VSGWVGAMLYALDTAHSSVAAIDWMPHPNQWYLEGFFNRSDAHS
jgi:hypothetical protein